MQSIRKIEEVHFDSLEELTEFVNNGGNAQYYSDMYNTYYPIVTNPDGEDVSIEYFSTLELVTEEDLDYIIGYKTM